MFFEQRCAADCFRELKVDVGNFSTPGFPVSLPIHPISREWKIESPKYHQIQLKFHVVDLPKAGRHATSYLSYGDFNALGQRLEYRRVHGRNKQVRPFTSAAQSAWVTMVSTGDPHQQHRGLLIEVSYVHYGQSSFFLRQFVVLDVKPRSV